MSVVGSDRTDTPADSWAPSDDATHGGGETSGAQRPPVSASPPSSGPPERDWTPWLDGRPRRLKRGKDYTGDPKPLVKNARESAEALGRFAVVSRDSQGKYEYVWVQFVDAEVELGRPCPVCGGTLLEKVQKHFLRCSTCGSVLVVAGDREVVGGSFEFPPPDPEVGAGVAGEEAARGAEEPTDSRRSNLGDMLETRVLSEAETEVTIPRADEPLIFETAVLTHRAGLTGTLVIALLAAPSAKAGRVKVFTSAMEARELGEAGARRFRAHLPPYLLSRFTYTVRVWIWLRDPEDGSVAILRDRDAASFSVELDLPDDQPSPGLVHPPIHWKLETAEQEAKTSTPEV